MEPQFFGDVVQARGGSAVRLPTSGQIFGWLVDWLGLKGFVREDRERSERQAQRYFAGAAIESAEDVEDIVRTFVESLVPASLAGSGDLDALHRAVCQEICSRLNAWDSFRAEISGTAFPVRSVASAVEPFLRLVVLDAGIRWGGFLAARIVDMKLPDRDPYWLHRDALRHAMDRFRPEGFRVEDLAGRVRTKKGGRVSRNTMDKWRQGNSSPRSDYITALASALASESGKDRGEIEFHLRIAVAANEARRAIDRTYDGHFRESRWEDLVAGFRRTAEIVCEMLLAPSSPALPKPDLLTEVRKTGARSSVGRQLCMHLAHCAAFREDLAADFEALPGNWDGRIREWCRRVASAEWSEEWANQMPPEHRRIYADVGRLLPWIQARMADFDQNPLEGFPFVTRIRSQQSIVENALRAGRDAIARGNYFEAVEHARRAVEAGPCDAYAQYALGAFLGQLMLSQQYHLEEEAIEHCEIAAALAPGWSAPLTEIGIIRFNAKHFDAAEVAYANAERFVDGVAHHFLSRGVNCMALKRFEDAAVHLRRALDIDPHMTVACEFLVPVLKQLGQHREAAKLARATIHSGGFDTLTEWELKLDPFVIYDWHERMRRPGIQRAHGT
jgi:tetratricopeptide (TPR) repeat protein